MAQFIHQDLPPLERDDFLPPVSRWTVLGGLVLVGTLLGSLALAAVVKYNVIVQASAIVRPASEVGVVQATREGTISRVLVQENQTVQQGQVMAEFAVSDRTSLQNLQTQQKQLQGYLQQYQTQLAATDSQLHALEADIAAKAGLTSPAIAASTQTATPIPPEILVQTALERLTIADAKTAQQIAKTRDRLLQRRVELMNQLNYDQQSLLRLRTDISKQGIQAPISGTILRLEVRTAGQTVRPGDAIAQIVPQDSPLILKARISAQDISRVMPQQEVQLRVSAYPYPEYGTLKGTVEAISPDVVTVRDGLTGASLSFYEVIIHPDESYLVKDGSSYRLQPGMEARADIISRQETLLQLLLRQARLWTDL